MISFNDTEIAFKHKSNKALKKANFLFNILANPGLVKAGKGLTNFGLALHLPINGIIRATIFDQFCGGENIEDCSRAIHNLWKSHVGTILDYSVEGKTSDEDFEYTTREIIATIAKGKGNPAIPFAVFKVTGISRFGLLEKANPADAVLDQKETKELNDLRERVYRICKAAHDAEVPVFIDAEESWIQDIIDRLAYEMMLAFNKERAIVYNTLQMYRHDRLAFLKQETEIAQKDGVHYGVKLVRGAYMEKERRRAAEKGYPSPIQPNKEASDTDYNLALDFILNHLNVLALCAGTHNEESSLLLTEMMQKKGINKHDKRIYFAQLLGMSDHISYNLANAGYNVAKYVPYGPIREVMPYLFRRADENTSVKGQTSRELNLIQTEIKRRKLK